MHAVTHPLVFGYFTAALLATAAVSLAAAVQFLLIGARRAGSRTARAFAALCLCAAGLALGRALIYAAPTLAQATAALRLFAGAVLLALPAMMTFIARYTARPMPRWLWGASLLIALALSAINLTAPGTVLYLPATLQAFAPIQLPWGESLFLIGGAPSWSGKAFYGFSYAVFAWAFYRALRQFHDGQRQRAAMLLVCLLLQFLALLWSVVAIGMLDLPLPAIDAFAFLSFVLLMSLTLVGQMHRRTRQLELTTAQLRAEATTRRQAEQGLRHAAWHDALTGLPNRPHAQSLLTGLMAEARQHGRHGSVLLLDLDHFKTVNESLGHHYGDQLLQAIVARLRDAVPAATSVARLGGDEFLILLPATALDAEAAAAHGLATATHVMAHLGQPLLVEQHTQMVSASLGVATYPGDAAIGAADLVRHADIALHRAKAAGRHTARRFEPDMQDEADTRLEMERGLHQALRHDELMLHYQPQVDADGQLRGAEALLRWQHPRLGLLYPDRFIAIAEETGLIHALGHWVIATACLQLRTWQAQGLDTHHLHLSINVSPWQLTQPGFADAVATQVADHGIAPTALTLELTESALLEDFGAARQALQRLSVLGFRLSLDDFGTGYSSLAYLQQLPLDELKIDRAFVRALHADKHTPLAAFIIDVGKRLGMTTVAEGVDSAKQRATLVAMGCDLLQGYLIDTPLPAADFQRWLSPRRDDTAHGMVAGA